LEVRKQKGANKALRNITIKSIEEEFSCLEGIKEDLLKGYEILKDVVDVLKYTKDRGVDDKQAPTLMIFDASLGLLKDCLKDMGLFIVDKEK